MESETKYNEQEDLLAHNQNRIIEKIQKFKQPDKKNNFKELKPKYKKNKIIIHYLFSLLISILLNQCRNEYNYITIKIVWSGEQTLFNSTIKDSNKPVRMKIGGGDQNVVSKFNFGYENNNIDLIWGDNKIKDLSNLFFGCKAIFEVDLSHFDASQVTSMKSMFEDCINLKSINFNKLYTPNLIDMSSMFKDCNSLTSINIYFDTSKVTSIEYLFKGCYNLTNIYLSVFRNSPITNMKNFFYDCSTLSFIDLSFLQNSKVTNMNNMFGNAII